MSPPNGAAPPEAPRSPGDALVSREDTAGVSWDTDMASSAVVAAAGERVSPIFGGGQKHERSLTKRLLPKAETESDSPWRSEPPPPRCHHFDPSVKEEASNI